MFSVLHFTHFPLSVKLEDCIGEDYTYFCDVNEGYFFEYNDYVKFYDLFGMIKLINSEGIQLF